MRPDDRYLHGMNFALYVGGPCVIGAQELGALGIWVGAVPCDRLLWAMKQYQPTFIWSIALLRLDAWARRPSRRATTRRRTSPS